MTNVRSQERRAMLVSVAQHSEERRVPRVSVIIPTHNRADLVTRAIDSALNQTVRDIEVIVVDDASRDDTAAVVAGYHDPRLTFIQQKTKLGGAAARNRGLTESKGEFIAFLDSDDEWLPEKLKRQLAVFDAAADGVGLVSCDVEGEMDAVDLIDGRPLAADPGRLILVRNAIGSASLPLIRRALVEQVGGFDTAFPSCQDWELWARILPQCEIVILRDQLVRYLPSEVSITSDNDASLRGHRLFAATFAERISALSRREKAWHNLHMGRSFWWKGDKAEGLRRLLLAALLYPRLAAQVLDIMLLRPLRTRFAR